MPDRTIDTSLRQIPDASFGYEEARHLLLRAGFGGTPTQIRLLASWGPERAVDHLLEPGKIDAEAVTSDRFDRDIMRPPTEAEREAARRARRMQDEETLAQLQLRRQQSEREDRRQMAEIRRWWLVRLIESGRPLEEKMTLFWHGHFATSYRTIENSYHMFMQNQLFRSHAIGNYGALLHDIIRDPAMLQYLNNDRNVASRPNENLARELMELFSLGVGSYTERDIKEGARALTGYTFADDGFRFNERVHDRNTKRILGASGPMDGDDFCGAILDQRACSEFMTWKLYDFFVRHLPDPSQVDAPTMSVLRQLAGTFRSSGYEIKPLLRRLFLSRHFYDESLRNERIKSPVELVVGSIRSLHTPARDVHLLADAMDLMGQNLFQPPSVKGWEGGRSWINTSTMFVRQNILNFLLTGKKPEGYDALANQEKYDPTPLLSDFAGVDPTAMRNVEGASAYLLRFMLGRAPGHAQETLVEFVRGHGGEMRGDVLTGCLLLVASMPEYQLC